jgi:transcription termination/antitermination protein NusG
MATQFATPLPSHWASFTQCQQQWFAAATVAKHEKAIAKQFQLRSIEHYLPLYRSSRQWKDRRVILDLPLFSGYIFVHMAAQDKGVIERVPGVLRLVSFNGALAAISAEEIESLQKVTELWNAEPYPHLSKGKRVRVCSGPLDGVEGIVLHRKGKVRIVISVASIMQSFQVEVDATTVRLEPVRASRPAGAFKA